MKLCMFHPLEQPLERGPGDPHGIADCESSAHPLPPGGGMDGTSLPNTSSNCSRTALRRAAIAAATRRMKTYPNRGSASQTASTPRASSATTAHHRGRRLQPDLRSSPQEQPLRPRRRRGLLDRQRPRPLSRDPPQPRPRPGSQGPVPLCRRDDRPDRRPRCAAGETGGQGRRHGPAAVSMGEPRAVFDRHKVECKFENSTAFFLTGDEDAR